METNNEKENALNKLKTKNADMIILNSLRDANAGFGFDTNKVSVFFKDETSVEFELAIKKRNCKQIVELIIQKIKCVKYFLFYMYYCCICAHLHAQELQAKVTVFAQQVGSNVDKSVFTTLQNSLQLLSITVSGQAMFFSRRKKFVAILFLLFKALMQIMCIRQHLQYRLQGRFIMHLIKQH